MRTFVLFLVAVAAAGGVYFLTSTEVAEVAPPATATRDSLPAPSEDPGAPLVQSLPEYKVPFPGSSDLIAKRQKLRAYVTLEGWDRIQRETGTPVVTSSAACQMTEPAQGLFISRSVADSIAEGTSNIIFLSRNIPRCFATKSKITLAVDELYRGKQLYELKGEIVINRVFDPIDAFENRALLDQLQVDPNDAMFLANSETAPFRRPHTMTMLQVSFSPTIPVVDRVKIPNFVAGAEAIHAASIAKLFKQVLVPIPKPVLVDARDRRYLSAGLSYPGANFAPFVSSNPLQVQYRPDLDTSVVAGAKFDTTRLPLSRDVPLVIFGNDETDAAPLWMIRNLRLLNYRNLYYVVGGLKAMNALKEPIVF